MENAAPSLDFGVREDGTVEGWYVETHYRPCTGILTDHEHQCVRIVADDEGCDIETRVLFETLISDGWTPPKRALCGNGARRDAETVAETVLDGQPAGSPGEPQRA